MNWIITATYTLATFFHNDTEESCIAVISLPQAAHPPGGFLFYRTHFSIEKNLINVGIPTSIR